MRLFLLQKFYKAIAVERIFCLSFKLKAKIHYL